MSVGATVVIKYGGNAMIDGELQQSFAQNIVELVSQGFRPVVVHGGGPQISEMLDWCGITSQFVDGMRVTSPEAMHVVEMVLSGSVNKAIVGLINQAGGRAIGLSGKDDSMIRAKPLLSSSGAELGLVGDVAACDVSLIQDLLSMGVTPVIAPVGVSEGGEALNINADLVASALASALSAEKLLLLTNTSGVLNKSGALIEQVAVSDIQGLIDDGTIVGGMLPKMDCAAAAVRSGVGSSHIIDGRKPEILLDVVAANASVGTTVTI